MNAEERTYMADLELALAECKAQVFWQYLGVARKGELGRLWRVLDDTERTRPKTLPPRERKILAPEQLGEQVDIPALKYRDKMLARMLEVVERLQAEGKLTDQDERTLVRGLEYVRSLGQGL